jgi:DNA polymerase-3 subunit gamma/tau
VPPASASLYRRHRPRSFADVVGQEHVVRTLANAIDRGKVHHAYLFVGSRGTGKTSMAKILAASLNCEQGPTTTPCGTCESCVSIAAARSLDVIEMDAASNNSVDDIRDLREKVAFAPVSGRHKVYILDEAHMLSTAAWNAFLKTLEEPPPHTIFVLATTEANKVLPTVVDRCHRFDFGRPTIAQIGDVLRRVAGAEGIDIPDEAIALIARSATGSFRDALGTLEQLLAYSGDAGDERSEAVPLEDVLAVLGAADADLLFGAVDAIAGGDARTALLAAARLADSGRDIGRFFGDLEAHARALLVVQTLGGEVPPELRVTAEQDERLREQAARVSPTDVVRLLDLIALGLRAMKDGSDARTQVELALVKAAVPRVDASTKAVLSRLERLEGGAPRPTPAGRAPSVPATAAAAARAAEPAQAAPTSAAATPPERGAPAEPPRDGAASPAPASPAPSTVASVAVTADEEGQPAVAAVAVIEPGALDLEGMAELWPAVLESIEAERPLLANALRSARPMSLGDGELTLGWAESAGFSRKKAEDAANREAIVQAIRAVTGASLRLAHALQPDAEPAAAMSEDELIERFVEEFEAEILPPDTPSEEPS